jgi:hypothetical protein
VCWDVQWAAKVFIVAKVLRVALPMHIWGTSWWARELIFLKRKGKKFSFRISNKKLTFYMSFFNLKKKSIFWLFLWLITCSEAKQFSAFQLHFLEGLTNPDLHFSDDVLGKKFLKKLASKLGFLILPKFTSSEY